LNRLTESGVAPNATGVERTFVRGMMIFVIHYLRDVSSYIVSREFKKIRTVIRTGTH